MDADDEDFLVVGPVEDRDRAPLGGQALVAPEEVVVEVLGRRDLEAVDRDALRVHPAHHVPDRAVLAGRVHRLEDDEQAVCVLGGEACLQVVEEFDARLQQLLRLRGPRRVPARRRIEVPRQPDA
jgi:hypothetical protein